MENQLEVSDQSLWQDPKLAMQHFPRLSSAPTVKVRNGQGSKDLCDIPLKKIQMASKIPSKGLFFNIL
jgi:hypothetical protein